MPAFTYTALDGTGKTVTGNLAGRNKLEVYRELERQALHPVSVREEGDAKLGNRAATPETGSGPVKMKRGQVILFTEELADMLDAGLQLEQALRVLRDRQEDAAIRQVSAALRDDIREGAKFSAALKKASPSFDELYVNLVAAGEASGSLAEILRRLAWNLQVMNDLQSRVISALVYPAFLIGACALLLFVFGTVLMPQLTDLITSSNQQLPLLTRMLVAFSDFLAAWWWAILAAAVAAFLIFRGVIATKGGREWWDRYQLTIPLIGPVLNAKFYAQFCQALGNLVNNGVPLLNGLKLMGRATSNVFLRDKLSQVVVLVAEGAAVSSAMRKVGHFPSLMIDMLGVGEQTGQIGKSLQKSATRYDKELTTRIDRLTKMISPIVLIFMAVIVGVVAYAIISTLFQSAMGIRGRA